MHTCIHTYLQKYTYIHTDTYIYYWEGGIKDFLKGGGNPRRGDY